MAAFVSHNTAKHMHCLIAHKKHHKRQQTKPVVCVLISVDGQDLPLKSHAILHSAKTNGGGLLYEIRIIAVS